MIPIGIADDDRLARCSLSSLLAGSEDIDVGWTAKDGQEVLDLIRSPTTPPIQALLLDVQMPRMDGLTVARTLREEAPDLAILILTTFIADSIMEEAMAAGVRGFVAKEDDITSLAGAIRQAVEGNIVMSPASSAIIAARLRAEDPAPSSPSSSPQPSTEPRRSPGALPHGVALTDRELEILTLLADAMSNKQIARRLVLSEATVKTHVSTIIAKLGVQDRVGAVVYALRNELV